MHKKGVIKRRLKLENYENCLETTQLENEMNCLEKIKTYIDSLQKGHKEFIKKQ